jgi:hypothetical protein
MERRAARLPELPAPVDRRGVWQQREAKPDCGGKGQPADRCGAHSPREQQVRNEDQRGQLDRCRQAYADALASGAVRQRQVADHEGQQHDIDLPEE